MIDAYEIGIELLLQDGVSAGLAVVGRELAAVDAAVAATSAGLAELLRVAAGVRGEATAAIGSVKPARAVEPIAADVGVVPDVAGVVAPVPMGDGGDAVAATAPVVVPVVPQARVIAAGSVDVPAVPRAAVAEVPRELTAVVAAAPVPASEAKAASAQVPVPMVSAVVPSVAAAPAPAVVRDGAAMPVSEPVMPAAPRVVADAGAIMANRAVAPTRRGSASVGARAAHREAEFAVASGRGDGGAPSAGVWLERGAAPRRQHGGEMGGGGVVMLDGRLVGQWLTERMARDAARPGAGTTFFDPRQAPAWTPSGAV